MNKITAGDSTNKSKLADWRIRRGRKFLTEHPHFTARSFSSLATDRPSDAAALCHTLNTGRTEAAVLSDMLYIKTEILLYFSEIYCMVILKTLKY